VRIVALLLCFAAERMVRRDVLNSLRRDTVWAVRHEGIGDAFFDRDAVRLAMAAQPASEALLQAAFLQQVLVSRAATCSVTAHAPLEASAAHVTAATERVLGASVGPKWTEVLQHNKTAILSQNSLGVRVELGCEIARLEELAGDSAPIRVHLTNGVVHDVSFVVVAVGVIPSVDWCGVVKRGTANCEAD
jgi:hypothetical protein